MKPASRVLIRTIWFLITLLHCPSPLLFGAEMEVELKQVYSAVDLLRPVCLLPVPDESNREIVVQQNGKVVLLPELLSGVVSSTVLDISDRDLIEKDFEEGLLGFAFHPNFRENRKFYIYHTEQNPKRTLLCEYLMEEGKLRANLASRRVLFSLRQPFWNHNSGNLLFGPDGMLYVSIGDGGKGWDPHNLSQNLAVFYGKILRIDVDSRSGALEYGIPPDNPFVGKKERGKGILPEIWAYGLRNPWGMHFDSEDGTLWCADVGQATWEEINIIEKGGNYGWNWREGFEPLLRASEGFMPRPAEQENIRLIDPVHAYGHKEGLSITGGFVWRGEEFANLDGQYIYGDWALGTLWALDTRSINNGEKPEISVVYKRKNDSELRPTALCVGAQGRAYVLSWDGKIYQILKKGE